MKINAAGTDKHAFKPAFKSIRTDRLLVNQLAAGENSIIDNNKYNIYTALNNLSKQPDRNNIEFLINVSSSLKYGQGGENSEFKKLLDKDGITSSSPNQRENTDWASILDDTIRRAIDSSSDDVTDLESEYQKICEDNKKLTSQQQELLDLREEFTSCIINENSLEDSQALAQTARIRKNLDYFAASSEIPISDKIYCIKKLIYFMSDDYNITPQLKDKKLQVVDEMMNDMIIKTPEQEKLTIKKVDQCDSGICAAISVCRKAAAYENKAQFVDMILEELNDSPYMQVFDITDLGSGNKVEIPKTYIDYNRAIDKGYRIIDASAHNWMQNAHACGNGSIQTEHYIPFDDDNYGIYDDSSWYLGLSDSKNSEKKFLQALIKEKEFLSSVYRTKEEMKNTSENIQQVKKSVIALKSLSLGKLNNIFEDIFPEKSDIEISAILKDLFDFYNGQQESNEINVASKLPDKVKQNIVAQYLCDSIDNISNEQKDKINQNSKSIYLMTDEYVDADLKIKKLNRFNTPRSKYIYNQKLYNLAAAHRIAIEADVNMPDSVARYERLSGLPPRDIQISNYLKSLRSSFSSPEVRKRYTGENNEILSQEKLENELNSDLFKIETTIPTQVDMVLYKLTGENTSSLLSDTFYKIADEIENKNNKELLTSFQTITEIKGDKNKIVSVLKNWSEKLSNSPSRKDVTEAVRLLGYEDYMQFSYSVISAFISSLSEGITDEDYENLCKRCGGSENISSVLTEEQIKFQELYNEYADINEKWHVPSSGSNILSRLEKEQCVLSRRKLDILKNKFNSIKSELVKNEQIDNSKAREKANNKLFRFNKDENNIFNNIENMLPYMKKYCNTSYQVLNETLFDELEEQYSTLGMLSGQFWVREEGSSGLTANEQIRILEQMTGKPYHMEVDAYKAAEQIKEGKGSGLLAISVDDSDYAFHAQYIPAVTSETFVNPITKENIIKEIMWTDNSWGEVERKHYWNGHDGFYHTDYGNGYGWKNGFILSPDDKIGLPVKDLAESIGIESRTDEEFGLFSDSILPGTPVDTYQKLLKTFGYILNMKESEKLYNELEKCISTGYKFNINRLEKLDDIAEYKVKKLDMRLRNEIKSKEDFDNLPDDDELKFLFKKIAVYCSTDNPEFLDDILAVKDNDELEEITNEIIEENMGQMGAIAAKSDVTLENLLEYCAPEFDTLFNQLEKDFSLPFSEEERENQIEDIFFNEGFIDKLDGSLQSFEINLANQVVDTAIENIDDEKALRFFIEKAQCIIQKNIDKNIKIESLDNNYVSSPQYKNLIAAIDKYLNPASDEELLSLLQGLQMADYETADDFFDKLTPKDTGVDIKSPYYYVQQYKADNSKVTKAFSENILTSEIYSLLDISDDKEADEYTPEELYRTLYVKLSDLDVQKYIKAFKAEAFQKYKVRQAFPQPVVIPDETIYQSVIDMLPVLREYSDSVKYSISILQILSEYSSLQNNFSSEKFYNDLLNCTDVQINNENYETIQKFKTKLSDLYSVISNDDNLEILSEELKDLINQINSSKSILDGKKAGKSLNGIVSVFNQLYAEGFDETNFNQIKNEALKSMNDDVKVMVNANIEPKYRNDAVRKIYNYIDMYRKNGENDNLSEAEDELAEYFVDKHIIKNPANLLKECVQLLFDGKASSDEYQILKNYLLSALKIAEQTKIQYKLVQNQHEGISSKTRDLLPMFNVKLQDGSIESLDSESGMLYFIEQLKNENDNYVILNLFLEQSGLTKQALKALINNFDFDKSKNLIDEKVSEIKVNISDFDKLAKSAYEFNLKSGIKYKSPEDAVSHLTAFIKRKNPDYKDTPVYNNFINYLESLIYQDTNKSFNDDVISSILEEINQGALDYSADMINSQIRYLEDISAMLEERLDMLNSIRVPANCEENNMRNEFIQSFDELQNYYVENYKEMLDCINNSEFLHNQNSGNS